MNPSVVAEGFASALDRDDFEAAARFLTPDCLYEIGGHTMQGREPIIASYRENAEWVKANLDAIQYESVIEHTDAESATVLFTDHVQKAGQKFHFSSRQIF
ncbi:MAG: nuclear transport factor 2 family protein, partial [Bdellovibrionota bacterium]